MRRRTLDIIIISIILLMVGAMVSSPDLYGGLSGRIATALGFLVSMSIGWRLGRAITGITKVFNYWLLWVMLNMLQLVVFNMLDRVVASAIFHFSILLVLAVVWYLTVGRVVTGSTTIFSKRRG